MHLIIYQGLNSKPKKLSTVLIENRKLEKKTNSKTVH